MKYVFKMNRWVWMVYTGVLVSNNQKGTQRAAKSKEVIRLEVKRWEM